MNTTKREKSDSRPWCWSQTACSTLCRQRLVVTALATQLHSPHDGGSKCPNLRIDHAEPAVRVAPLVIQDTAGKGKIKACRRKSALVQCCRQLYSTSQLAVQLGAACSSYHFTSTDHCCD